MLKCMKCLYLAFGISFALFVGADIFMNVALTHNKLLASLSFIGVIFIVTGSMLFFWEEHLAKRLG